MKNKTFSLWRGLAVGVLMLFSASVFAQTTATGVVEDAASGEPIIGASILEVGTTNGTITDFDGNFTLTVADGATLEISYIGYKTQSLPAGQNMKVRLGEDNELLDEVVVVGYGVVKKNDATGSVTAIKPDNMNKGLNTNATDMMQGKIAGVNVTSNSGKPGEGATIRIRGGSSLSASNDPLIVIDGLAMDNNNIQGVSNIMAMINPSDIETFTVLKDASATAIYGSRASNGVIIITTKKGAAGSKPKFSYEGNVSMSNLTNRLETLSGDEIRQYAKDLGHPSSKTKSLGLYNTDWQDQVYRAAISTDHNFSITGGTKHMPYRFSLGYTDVNGIIKTSNMQRATASMNLSPSFLDKHLTFNLNAKGMYIYNQYEPGVVGAAISMDPTMPIKGGAGDNRTVKGAGGAVYTDQDIIDTWFAGYYQRINRGTYSGDGANWPYTTNRNSTGNPVASLDKDLYDCHANSGSFVGNLEVDYKIHGFEDLHLHANFGADYSYGKTKTTISPYSFQNHYTGWNYWEDMTKYNLQFNAYAQYYKDFNEKHHFDAMIGYEWQHFYRKGAHEGYGTYPTNSSVVKNGESMAGKVKEDTQDVYDWMTENYLVSFFGRVNYTALNRYMITATVRADGSSRFHKDNRWGWFPSVALGWKIKEEAFLRDVNWLSDLKLRLGYGITGQQDIGEDYQYMAVYTKTQNDHVYYPVGVDNYAVDDNGNKIKDADGNYVYYNYRPEAVNPELTWEKTTTYNAGIDFGFLNGRITGSIDYYYRKTTDLLNRETTVAAGANFKNKVVANIGSLFNQGVEFAINGVAIDRKNFKWDLGYNITWNENKITKLNAGDDSDYYIPTGGISVGTGNTIQAHKVGYAASSFYVYETQQYTDANGNKAYAIVDRDKNGQIDAGDLYIYHSPAAPVTMGFQTKFQFYHFDIGLSFRANIGNYVYNNVLAGSLYNVAPQNVHTDLNGGYFGLLTQAYNEYWSGMKSDGLAEMLWNDATGMYETTATTDNNDYYMTDYFVEKASFFRCDNITVGYSFEKNPKIKARLYLTVQNPFVISGYKGLDPEVAGGIDNNMYPRSMTTLLGLSLQF